MLASISTVKHLVKQLADMKTEFGERRYWAERAADASNANLCFRFGAEKEAQQVATKLQTQLNNLGFTNKVKYTAGNDIGYCGAYVRLQAKRDCKLNNSAYNQ